MSVLGDAHANEREDIVLTHARPPLATRCLAGVRQLQFELALALGLEATAAVEAMQVARRRRLTLVAQTLFALA